MAKYCKSFLCHVYQFQSFVKTKCIISGLTFTGTQIAKYLRQLAGHVNSIELNGFAAFTTKEKLCDVDKLIRQPERKQFFQVLVVETNAL